MKLAGLVCILAGLQLIWVKKKNMSVQNEESLKSGLVVGFTQDKKFLFSGKY